MKDFDLNKDVQISASEELLECSGTLKHEFVHIAEFLIHKYRVVAEP